MQSCKTTSLALAMSAILLPATSLQASVAVLGSGIAGSTAARRLADAGMSVTVFECGRGVGGQTSTRVTRDERRFAFDHGAQYVSSPKTAEFREALEGWLAAGCVKEWKGRVADVEPSSSGGGVDAAPEPEGGGGGGPRYVGHPAMSSICANLLDHKRIDVVIETRACAAKEGGSSRWTLTSHGDDRPLGSFDWLVCTDRLSFANGRADLRDAPTVVPSEFKSRIETIESMPILALMVAFESPLDGIPFDGIRFKAGDDGGAGAAGRSDFGALGWAARDTSKPGRERDDGRECWIVQSNPDAAKEVIDSIDESDFETRKRKVAETAKEILLSNFLKAVKHLNRSNSCEDASDPEVAYAVGHRWSAAFPSVPPSTYDNSFSDLDGGCYEDLDGNFVVCGDYLGNRRLVGRVEGAYLSGRAAALAILDAVGGLGKE